MEHILDKLGFHSRGQIAAWVTEHRLVRSGGEACLTSDQAGAYTNAVDLGPDPATCPLSDKPQQRDWYRVAQAQQSPSVWVVQNGSWVANSINIPVNFRAISTPIRFNVAGTLTTWGGSANEPPTYVNVTTGPINLIVLPAEATIIIGGVEIRHLRYFVAVAEELNFGRAAARLQVAQPGLSQQIRSLETDLGLRLFDRTKRRVALTDAGSVLLTEAYATLSRFDQTLDRMREVKAGAPRSTLRVAMFPTCTLGQAFVTELRRRLPQVVVALEALPSAALVNAVERGELELGVVRSVAPHSRVSRRLLVTEPLGACISVSHPLATSASVRVACLSGLPLIWMPRSANPELYDHVVATLAAAGLPVDAVESAGSVGSTLALVSRGLGWALACESELSASGAATGVVWKTLVDVELFGQTWVVWPPKPVSPVIDQIVDALVDIVPATAPD